jgi:hypothetical protein
MYGVKKQKLRNKLVPAPTRRSADERAMYAEDHTLPRVSDTKKVIRLDPPDRIKDHPQKLDCWNFVCNDLAFRELLSPSYIFPITMLVDNIVAYNEYLEMLEGSGPLVPRMDRTGEKVVEYVKNPLFDMVKKLEVHINKQCEKFGLNPRDAIYVTNPDIKSKPIEVQSSGDGKNGMILYFNDYS